MNNSHSWLLILLFSYQLIFFRLFDDFEGKVQRAPQVGEIKCTGCLIEFGGKVS